MQASKGMERRDWFEIYFTVRVRRKCEKKGRQARGVVEIWSECKWDDPLQASKEKLILPKVAYSTSPSKILLIMIVVVDFRFFLSTDAFLNHKVHDHTVSHIQRYFARINFPFGINIMPIDHQDSSSLPSFQPRGWISSSMSTWLCYTCKKLKVPSRVPLRSSSTTIQHYERRVGSRAEIGPPGEISWVGICVVAVLRPLLLLGRNFNQQGVHTL